MSSRPARRLVLLLIGAVIGGIVALALLGRSPLTVGPGLRQPRLGLTLHGRVEPAARHEITAPFAGTVAGLMVSPGQAVATGQELLQLDAPALRRQLFTAQQELSRLQERHDKSSKNRRAQEHLNKTEALLTNAAGIVQERRQQLANYEREHPDAVTALDTLRQARERLAAAESARDRADKQFQAAADRAGATGRPDPDLPRLKAERDQRHDEWETAQGRWAQACAASERLQEKIKRLVALRQGVDNALKLQRDLQTQLDRVKQEPEVALLLQDEQRLKRAQDRITKLEQQVAALSVRAPAAGLLQDLRARPGQPVKQGQVLAIVEDAAGARLVFSASPADLGRLAVGWRVTITPQGGKPFQARITELDPAGRLLVQPLKPTPLPPPQTPLQAKL